MARFEYRVLLWGIMIVIACVAGGSAAAGDVVTVDTHVVWRTLSGNPIGINFNYLRDDNHNRPAGSPTIQSVMRQMNIQWVRYPGGEMSDWHFFSTPPYTKADPKVLTYNEDWGGYYDSVNNQDILGFDEYIQYLRDFGGRAYVVVPYESYERSHKTKEEFIEHAVAWVRYANAERAYGVRYWEIGSENWHNNTGTATEIAQVAKEFAQAMKAVDPNIKVGCSGDSPDWFRTLLVVAGAELDFVTVSNYCGWIKDFDYYRRAENVILDYRVRPAAQVIQESSHKDRLRVVVAEFNAINWSETWPDKNDLGHAIVSFDMAGQLLCNKNVEFAMLWGTRYMEGELEKNSYALGNRNEILPAGQPLAIWGRFLKSQMVEAAGPKDSRCFASFEPKIQALTVFVINKNPIAREVRIEVKATSQLRIADVYTFAGTGETDMRPSWLSVGTLKVSENTLESVKLSGTSITVLDMKKED
jgi:alpha-L-arabinofuranosidase